MRGELRRSVGRICLLIYAIPTVPLMLGPSGLMVLIAETAAGRTFALAAIALWFAVPLWIVGLQRRRAGAGAMRAAACVGVAAALIGVCGAWAPDEQPAGESGASSVFSGAVRYRRWTPASLVPEIDQFKLGSYLMPLLDPLIDLEQSRRLRGHFLEVYRELGADAEFSRLTSVMSFAYGDLFLAAPQPDHTFVYIPVKRPAGKLPVLMFLHGSCGNFQAYLWVLKALAEQEGIAVVAPSLGFGAWNASDRPGRPGGVSRIRAALRFVEADARLDRGRIALAGLSNGGLGVTRVAIALPAEFRQLIYISPMIEPSLVGEDGFCRAWRGRPVHILHGDRDNRIPLPLVEQAAATMRQGGVSVGLETFPGEEHWLFFSKRREIVRLMAGWLRTP